MFFLLTAMDWSLGHYEHTATQLLPAREWRSSAAAPAAGERPLDVGCGTGNAALLAAAAARRHRCRPRARLLEVARRQAAADGVDATFLEGDAASLPSRTAARTWWSRCSA